MVTIIIMFVVSLIVLGFARVVRREQRQALDRQLNTQAFYAAEAGVNYAVQEIKDAGPTAILADKEDCEPGGDFPGAGGNYDVDAANNVEFTCLLVDPSPPSLKYDNIGTDKSQIIPIRSADGSNIQSVTFSWEDTDDTTGGVVGCPSSPSFPKATSGFSTCGAGILRVDLVPTEGTFTRQDLIDNNMTAFFYPNDGGGTLAYGSAAGFSNQGAVQTANCTVGGLRLCSIRVNGLNAKSYLIRVKSIYKANALTITATTSAPGSTNEIIGTQAIVDSTGKAGDVLRRIQVRVPTTNLSDDLFPEFALQSQETICKRFSSAAGLTPIFDSASGCSP